MIELFPWVALLVTGWLVDKAIDAYIQVNKPSDNVDVIEHNGIDYGGGD